MSDVTDIRSHRAELDFRVVRERIPIYPDEAVLDLLADIEDGQKLVYVSIGAGETRVNILDGEARSMGAWTAVYGWSSLSEIEVHHKGQLVDLSDLSLLTRALRASLRIYGEGVDTSDFIRSAKGNIKSAVGHILDKTIGAGKEYDRIILAAPHWLHGLLSECRDIRPHIASDIQDI